MGLSSLCLTFFDQNTTTERIDLPSCIRSNPLLISSSLRTCVIIGSISIFPFMYQSTIFVTSVRPRAAARRAFPHPAGHKLERPGGNFLAGFRYPDHRGDAPATVTRLERLAHH